jgi:hypothetical protein
MTCISLQPLATSNPTKKKLKSWPPYPSPHLFPSPVGMSQDKALYLDDNWWWWPYLQMLFTSLGRITTYAGLFDTRLFNSKCPPFSLLPFGHLFGQPRLSSHSIHFQSTSCFQSAGSELNKSYRRTRIAWVLQGRLVPAFFLMVCSSSLSRTQ